VTVITRSILSEIHALIYIYFSLLSQTVKCLLIVPNAESALNEEAGKLLLEHYEDYSQRARMMTEIHALVCVSSFEQSCSLSVNIKKCVSIAGKQGTKGE